MELTPIFTSKEEATSGATPVNTCQWIYSTQNLELILRLSENETTLPGMLFQNGDLR
jgi:hypothetical protein